MLKLLVKREVLRVQGLSGQFISLECQRVLKDGVLFLFKIIPYLSM